MSHKVSIFGGGGIGRAVGFFLARHGVVDEIRILDANQRSVEEAADFLRPKVGSGIKIETRVADLAQPDSLGGWLEGSDLLLDCLPGHLAVEVAKLARAHGKHYVNATEHVAATRAIEELAAGAEQAFVLQAGLAPGYVNILGMALLERAEQKHQVEAFDRLEMRVGALTRHAGPPAYYGWTWSTAGVATEYVEDALVVRDHQLKLLPALSERRLRVLGGVTYEEDLTSGGAADLPEKLAAKVREIDYKTLRWPGHYAYVEKVLGELAKDDPRRIENLEQRMADDVPHVEQDKVVISAALEFLATGPHGKPMRRRLEVLQDIPRKSIAGTYLRAIQSTTASSLAEVARMALQGKWRGVVTQSQIPPQAFLAGPIVTEVYGEVEIAD